MERSGYQRLAPTVLVIVGGMVLGCVCAAASPGSLVAQSPGGRVAAGQVQKPSAYGEVSEDASADRLLRQFEKASVADDANLKSELYAQLVDRYFLKTHVTREFVYRDLLDWLSRGRLITSFRLTVLSTEGRGDERTLLVRKEASWIDGGSMRVLTTRSQFILRKIGSEWKIVSERDYKPER